MPDEPRNHHYVPQWYQRRFLTSPTDDGVLHLRSLTPRSLVDARGIRHPLPPVRRRPIKSCFAEEDLYTVRIGTQRSAEIETLLFGKIDAVGSRAVDYWSNFVHPSVEPWALDGLLAFMSAQKLRTPKGLDWLASQVPGTDSNQRLRAMVQLQGLYSAIWCECIWQIADARESQTKFIVSDHPITIYNRVCGPRHERCRGANDPDIRLHGSHTIFPLDLERVLILTNLSWARNPYQRATDARPNPQLYRDTIFNFTDVQTHRLLTEHEVRQINFIIKSRAYRFVAAAHEEWLFPETYVSKSDWATYGNGYLLMPDPRGLAHGGEYVLGYKDGSSEAFDAYGRRPWQHDFADFEIEDHHALQEFQGEFARLYGPKRRGRSFEITGLEAECDSDDFHAYHLGLERRRKRS